MNIKITFLFLLFPFLLCAQSKKTKHKKRHKSKPPIHKTGIEDYYAKLLLEPNAAQSPYLYYQVYDWVGTKYSYSGETKKGIDCSGFVCEMYKNTYCVNLSGSSRDLWLLVNPIEKIDLNEGDILFFKIKRGEISHVGIYLGNNKFAHASVQSGVIISDLDEAYYKKYFFKGGRLK